MKRLLLLSLLVGCETPTGPDFPMSGEWGIEGYAPGEGCAFYELVTVSGTRFRFEGEGVAGNRDAVLIGPHILSIKEESRNSIRGSYLCDGAKGAWSMWRYDPD